MIGLDGLRIENAKQERNSPHTQTDHENNRHPLQFEFFLFFPPVSCFLCWTSHWPVCTYPFPPFVFVMPKKVGPWQLDEVKARLRAEQVGRERAASARYRRQERQDSGEDNKGKTSWAQCIFLLALSCFLFSLSVLAFASAFLSIYREIE